MPYSLVLAHCWIGPRTDETLLKNGIGSKNGATHWLRGKSRFGSLKSSVQAAEKYYLNGTEIGHIGFPSGCKVTPVRTYIYDRSWRKPYIAF